MFDFIDVSNEWKFTARDSEEHDYEIIFSSKETNANKFELDE